MFDSNKIYNSNANWFQNSQGNYDYVITYGPNQQRRKTVLQSGIGDDVLLTKYYAFGDYEKEVTPTGTRHLHYISGGDGLAAIYVKYSNAPDSLYFITTDHLGSIVGAINSTTGTIFKQNFDAWGRKRNPQTWSYTNIPDFPFDRGYTGHEHLKWFGLINMNGRMYDAAVCRFLSPDPYVQMPDYTQNFNRYSYALNNPLLFTDPSGEIPILAVLAYVAMQGIISGDMAKDSEMGFWGGFALGAGTAAISMGVGPLIRPIMSGTGFLPGAVNPMVPAAAVGTVTYGITSIATGQPFNWQGLGMNIGIAGVLGGLDGGFNSITHGGKFFTGEGATYYSIASGNEQGVKGTPDNYTDDYLDEFTNKNFRNTGRLTMHVSSLSADCGTNATFTEDGFFDITNGPNAGEKAWGYCRCLGLNEGYGIWISKAAFVSNQRLYLTLGHEFLHVNYAYSGLFTLPSEEHGSIYKWELEQAKKFYMAGSARTSFNKYKQFWTPKNDLIWKNLVPIRSTKSFGW